MLFGLWHGLVFLPVVLSLIGAPSHKDGTEDYSEDDADSQSKPEKFDSYDEESIQKSAGSSDQAQKISVSVIACFVRKGSNS